MARHAEARAHDLVKALTKAGVTRLVCHFEYRANDGNPVCDIGGYELYQPWLHERAGYLYVDATHEFEQGHAIHGRPKCRRCGEGPLDGDHYQEGDTNPEPEIVAAAVELLTVRFATALAAGGVLKADVEANRVWADVAYETGADEADAGLEVDL